MQITEVRIHEITGSGPTRAVASITLDGQWAVHGIRVVDGPRGLFVAMPERKTESGEYREVAHPVTADARRQVIDAVLRAYREHARRTPAHDAGELGR